MRYLLLLLIFSIGLPLFSQDDWVTDPTVESNYLEAGKKLEYIQNLADEPDETAKLKALDLIEEVMLENEQALEMEVCGIILNELATEGLLSVVYEQRVQANDFPRVRQEASRIIGVVGGEKAEDTLIIIMNEDYSVSVLVEAAASLWGLGNKNSGAIIGSLIDSIIRIGFPNNDEYFIHNILVVINNIVENSEIVLSDRQLDALVTLSGGNYRRVIRTPAQEILEKLGQIQ